MLKDLNYKLRILLSPSYWIMNNSYSKDWDAAMLASLEAGEKFTDIDDYTARFGGRLIWIANHPYASFTPRSSFVGGFRPSRVTIMKLRERLEECIIEQLKEAKE